MLICNIGNQHFGSFERAKELIKAANDSGADLIKSYALSPNQIGPLDKEFYEMCCFCFEEYIELIEYAKGLGNDLFFELHGPMHESILFHQTWRSVTSFDFNNIRARISDLDKDTSIVSIGPNLFPPNLIFSNIMHSMERLSSDPHFNRINILKRIYNKNIGFSDKTIGIDACIIANDIHGCVILEKNLTLEKGVLFKGKLIEENIYSVFPDQFERLANQLMVFKEDLILH